MKIDIARAWKDPLYRQSLSEEERQMLPENPVGALELTDDILETVYGARGGSHDHWRGGCGGGSHDRRRGGCWR